MGMRVAMPFVCIAYCSLILPHHFPSQSTTSTFLFIDNFLVPFLRAKHPKILKENPAMQVSLDIYVPLQFSLIPSRPGQVIAASQTFSLEQFMKALVRGTIAEIHDCFPDLSRAHTDIRVFFIQGLAGAGKSLFCWRTMQFWDKELVISPSTGTGRLPIVITLPNVKCRVLDAPVDFLVQGIIDAYPTLAGCFEHLDQGTRQELFSCLPFLFFLDSVDELSDAIAIASVNRLYNIGQWRESVFVITCRSEVLDNVVINTALAPRQLLPDGPVQPGLMVSLYLLPFSATQRDTYITVFARNYADLSGWTAEQYSRAMKRFSELDAFLQEPLQLFLVLSVLPILVAGKEDIANADFCITHQRVGHVVHLLYQDKDLAVAQKLAADIERHPDAKRKGVTVFLKATCGPLAGSTKAMCQRHLVFADVIVPLMSSPVASNATEFLDDLVLAMAAQAARKVMVCPLYLSMTSEKDLMKTIDILSPARKSVKLLGKLQGLILKPERPEWTPLVNDVIKHFATRKLFIFRLCLYVYIQKIILYHLTPTSSHTCAHNYVSY